MLLMATLLGWQITPMKLIDSCVPEQMKRLKITRIFFVTQRLSMI